MTTSQFQFADVVQEKGTQRLITRQEKQEEGAARGVRRVFRARQLRVLGSCGCSHFWLYARPMRPAFITWYQHIENRQEFSHRRDQC